MTRHVRTISDDQCQWFAEDMEKLDHELARVLGRHASLYEDIWLGGNRDADNTEKAPARTTRAMELLIQARALVQQAAHEVVMYRARGDK